ncbi:nucleoside recognition pore and gate family inner membrane transporter [Gammaproteobacteria bacterium]|nr:nucleoside recognition pore and gate family inner membrane transporter [Gammaproteobacteria bacterium]
MSSKEITSTDNIIEDKVGIGAYIALFLAVIFFSGITVSDFTKNIAATSVTYFSPLPAQDTIDESAQILIATNKKNIERTHEILSVFDFNTLNGKFGTLISSAVLSEDGKKIETKRSNFTGSDGVGARSGFMFALSLIPTVMFALGMVAVIEHYGALDAMRKILSAVLRPLLGVSGETGLALIASLQSTDAGAGMTRTLADSGHLTEKEKNVFTMFQFSAGAPISNFLSSGVVLLALTNTAGDKIPTSIGMCLLVMFVMKFFGANLFRLYLHLTEKDDVKPTKI